MNKGFFPVFLMFKTTLCNEKTAINVENMKKTVEYENENHL
ncbi:hypothetical protein SAM19_02355 [Brevibacillus laterosporus]|nr:hypothetical protein [Brevibacillus laterosporus]